MDGDGQPALAVSLCVHKGDSGLYGDLCSLSTGKEGEVKIAATGDSDVLPQFTAVRQIDGRTAGVDPALSGHPGYPLRIVGVPIGGYTACELLHSPVQDHFTCRTAGADTGAGGAGGSDGANRASGAGRTGSARSTRRAGGAGGARGARRAGGAGRTGRAVYLCTTLAFALR